MRISKYYSAARVAIVLLFITVGVFSVASQPVQDTWYTYYSDNTYTVVVGHLYDMCYGRWSDGYATAYVDKEVGEPCNGSGCSTCLQPEMSDEWSVCTDGYDNDDDDLVDCWDPGCGCW